MFDSAIVQSDSFQTVNGTARIVPEWLTGFEQGTLSIAGTTIADTVSATAPTIISSGQRTGNYALQVAPTATVASNMTKVITGSNKKVIRFYLKNTVRPGAGTFGIVLQMVGPTALPTLRLTDAGVLQFSANNGTFSNTSATISTTVYSLVEVQIDTSTNTFSMEVKVDGVTNITSTGAGTAANMTSILLGTTSTTGPAYTAQFDDVIVGTFTGSIPNNTAWWGGGAIYGLSAHTARASHITGATTAWRSYDANTTTDVNKHSILWYGKTLNDLPMNSILTRVEQVTASASLGASPYLDIPLAQLTQSTRKVNGVRAVMAQHNQSATTANVIPLYAVREDGTTFTVWNTNVAGSTAIIYRGAVVTAPTSGWNSYTVNDLYYRIGGSNDIAPVGSWDAVLFEADINTPPAITQAAYRYYEDGTETGSTAIAAQDTNITRDVTSDSNLQLRVRLQETAGSAGAIADDYQLQFSKNTGAYENIGEFINSSYSESNQSIYSAVGLSNNLGISQSFTTTEGTLSKAVFYLKKTGTPTGNAVAKIYAHSGTLGTSSVPTGSALATSDNLDVSTLTTTAQLITLNFSGANKIRLTSGTNYVVALEFSGGGIGNTVDIGSDNSSPTHTGNFASTLDGSSWTANANIDVCFYVYVNSAEVIGFNSASLTDGNPTTNRLGAGTGFFVAGEISEDGLVDNRQINASYYTEHLYSLTIKSTAVANNDTLDFRILRNGAATDMTYTVTPRVTVSVSGGATTTQTTTGKARIEKTVSPTITGKAAIQKTTTKDQLGKGRIQKTVTTTTTGVARVQKTVSPTITGKAAVQKTTTQNTTGKARLQKTVPQTTTGVARINKVVSQTQTGKSAIQKTVAQTMLGKAAVQKTTTRTQLGVSRIQKTATQNITGVARVQKTVSSTQTGVGRIQKTVSQTQTGVANIATSTVTTTKTQTGVARVEKGVAQTTTGRGRIQKIVTSNQSGTARIQKTVTQTTTGRARLQKTVAQTILGKAAIQKTVTRTQTGVSRIQKTVSSNQTGVARVTRVVPQATTGKARIQKTVTQDTTGKARVQKTVTSNQTGVSRVVKTESKTQTGVSRINKIVTQTQLGKAAVLKTTTRTQTGVSNIVIDTSTSRTQTGRAAIQKTTGSTTTGVSRISKTVDSQTSGKARVELAVSRVITGQSSITSLVGRSTTGTARIVKRLYFTIIMPPIVLPAPVALTIRKPAPLSLTIKKPAAKQIVIQTGNTSANVNLSRPIVLRLRVPAPLPITIRKVVNRLTLKLPPYA